MAMSFRMNESLDRFGIRQCLLAVRCEDGWQDRLRAALRSIEGVASVKSLAEYNGERRQLADGRWFKLDPAEQEIWEAYLDSWPDDILAFGVDNLRAALVVAGLVDRSEAA